MKDDDVLTTAVTFHQVPQKPDESLTATQQRNWIATLTT